MSTIKKNNIVVRKSYGKDIIFKVVEILEIKKQKIAVLKGITERIQANSPIEDLEIIDKEEVEKTIRRFDDTIKTKIKKEKIEPSKNYGINILNKITNSRIKKGRILHLDGDSCLDNKNSLLTNKH